MDAPEKQADNVRHDDLETVLAEQYDTLDTASEEPEGDITEDEQHETPETIEVEEQGTEELETAAEEEDLDVEITAEEEDPGAEVEEDPEYNEAAPERWPQDMKDYYSKLDPQGKQIMLENIYKPMQRNYSEATQQLARQRESLKPIMDAMQQYSPDFDKAGVTPVEAIRQQMAWTAHIAKVGPQQGLLDMAKAYGVEDFGQQGGASNKDDKYLTPIERGMKTQIEELRKGLETRNQLDEQRGTDARKDVQTRHLQEAHSSLQQFVEATKDGSPLHPHVEKVAPRMTGLIRGGLVDKVDDYGQPIPYPQQLGQAYKMACDMDPSIRGVRVSSTRKQQVAKAKANNRSVVSKTPAGSVDVQEGPIMDTIEDIYDQLDRSVAR